ncbi:MAG: hypothetical protein A7316_09690 [Candidatus Altiarchaeales archaeon WOR_SM1_86-2]|nr:MAG: hypothetical protein A7316_09690 [Candidatus Altiarchaeales archaeon WOR_SM1_86-2]
MDKKKIENAVLWAMVICVGIVTILSIPKYIFGGDPWLPILIKIFSFILGGFFGLYLLMVILNGTWQNYMKLSIPAVAFWGGLLAVALLCATGMGVGFYSGEVPFIPVGTDLPQWLDQSIVPLRAIVLYMTIAVGIICASLLIFKPKSTAH